MAAVCGLIFAGLQILATSMHTDTHACMHAHIIPQLEILLFHNVQHFPFLISIIIVIFSSLNFVLFTGHIVKHWSLQPLGIGERAMV
jgi:hypothetical protein